MSDYKEKATAYLQDIKLIAIRIQSLRQDIRKLQYDIITLSAIDYSKDRVSGGGTPVGLEGDVARLVDTVDAKKREIAKGFNRKDRMYTRAHYIIARIHKRGLP